MFDPLRADYNKADKKDGDVKQKRCETFSAVTAGRGIFSIIIVTIMAMTPSLKASILFFSILILFLIFTAFLFLMIYAIA